VIPTVTATLTLSIHLLTATLLWSRILMMTVTA
jgi:hypothetical protein